MSSRVGDHTERANDCAAGVKLEFLFLEHVTDDAVRFLHTQRTHMHSFPDCRHEPALTILCPTFLLHTCNAGETHRAPEPEERSGTSSQEVRRRKKRKRERRSYLRNHLLPPVSLPSFSLLVSSRGKVLDSDDAIFSLLSHHLSSQNTEIDGDAERRNTYIHRCKERQMRPSHETQIWGKEIPPESMSLNRKCTAANLLICNAYSPNSSRNSPNCFGQCFIDQTEKKAT